MSGVTALAVVGSICPLSIDGLREVDPIRFRFLFVLLIVLGTSTDVVVGASQSKGVLYSVVQDRKGAYLAKWDWRGGYWQELFPGMKHAKYREDGIPSNPLVPLGRSEYLTQVNRKLTYVSHDGQFRTILDDDVSDFCYNATEKVIFVITCQGSFVYVTWPGLVTKTLESCPPLSGGSGWPATVSSRGKALIVGGGDGRIYLAKVGEYIFSAIGKGVYPRLSPSGKSLAFSEPFSDDTVNITVLDMSNRQGRSWTIRRAHPIPMWIGDDVLVFSYRWRMPLPLQEDEIRFIAIDLNSGARERIPLAPNFGGGFTWAPQ